MYRPNRTAAALAVAASLAVAAVAGAQTPPATDLYLVAVDAGADGAVRLGTPRALTDRAGYDNQPAFLPGGETLVYTSFRDGQADVMRIGLGGGEAEPVLATAESEYSPTPIPDGGGDLSTVRVEADGTQRLWRLPAGGGEPTLLLPDVAPVGYHAWDGPERLALFVLGQPPTLATAAPGPGEAKTLASDVGRALQPLPDGGVAYVQLKREGETADVETKTIHRIDLTSGESEPILALPAGVHDFAVGPDGALWMAEGTTIHRHRPGVDGGWVFVGDLADGVSGPVSRIAVAPDGAALALVAERSDD